MKKRTGKPNPPTAKMTAFQRRLAELGDEAAGRVLRQNPRTIRAWRYGARFPRPAMAIVIITKRWPDLSLADIYARPPKAPRGRARA